jgi:hypothetical protein
MMKKSNILGAVGVIVIIFVKFLGGFDVNV